MKESEFILLLSKKFSGEISPAESTLLDEWLGQSPENEQFARQAQVIWEKSEGYRPAISTNLDADFSKIQSRIQAQSTPVMRATLGQKLMRAAAVLVLLLSATWAWHQYAHGPGETLVAAEQEAYKTLGLPDGSKVWLRKGSQLKYAEEWNGSERLVTLHGEAYFEVQHDPAHPFKVKLANGGSVEVLGTQFDVCQINGQTSVIVRSGKVRFSPVSGSVGPVLTANQKAVFDPKDVQVRVSALHSLNELSWQTGGLEFVNTPLTQVISDLEKYYNVRIALRNPAMNECPHSAPLTSQPIDQVLESLALTHQLTVKKLSDRSYELSGGQCR